MYPHLWCSHVRSTNLSTRSGLPVICKALYKKRRKNRNLCCALSNRQRLSDGDIELNFPPISEVRSRHSYETSNLDSLAGARRPMKCRSYGCIVLSHNGRPLRGPTKQVPDKKGWCNTPKTCCLDSYASSTWTNAVSTAMYFQH